ncbi:MAG TPA: lipocalin-like domain-containing protein [Thermodesulfovibrionales bacterium]|nr:lipocalin-like domain-containing protein [Thermodesulfovibrionales bacterium]
MQKLFLAFLITAFLAGAPVFAGEYRDVTPDYYPKFPEDFYYKPDFRVQWWYFTGHLFDEKGREFGYELTFFGVGIQKRVYRSRFGVNTLFISHLALSDVEGKSYRSFERADSGAFDSAGARDDRLKVWIGKDSLQGTTERMHLTASEGNISLDLNLVPTRPVVLHGEHGYSRKSEESPLYASCYFSFTDLETEGTISMDNMTFRVKGKSWFDREISSEGLAKSEKGWDWFALQLDDGREIMLYLLRKTDGMIDTFSSGTFVYGDGSYRSLALRDFTVTVLDHFRSEKTGAYYPSRWQIHIPSENLLLTVTPLIKDQEFLARYSTGNFYWEGTARIEGTAGGRAYVEMTGY